MRTALSFVLLAISTALAWEANFSDERRTEMSAAVFAGTVTNVQRLPLVRTNTIIVHGGVGPGPDFGSRFNDRGLWSAEVLVDSITKQDLPLGKVALVYYEQSPIPSFVAGCPGYPAIKTNMHATFWCHRVTIEGHTNVLYVSTASWLKSK